MDEPILPQNTDPWPVLGAGGELDAYAEKIADVPPDDMEMFRRMARLLSPEAADVALLTYMRQFHPL